MEGTVISCKKGEKVCCLHSLKKLVGINCCNEFGYEMPLKTNGKIKNKYTTLQIDK